MTKVYDLKRKFYAGYDFDRKVIRPGGSHDFATGIDIVWKLVESYSGPDDFGRDSISLMSDFICEDFAWAYMTNVNGDNIWGDTSMYSWDILRFIICLLDPGCHPNAY